MILFAVLAKYILIKYLNTYILLEFLLILSYNTILLCLKLFKLVYEDELFRITNFIIFLLFIFLSFKDSQRG